MTPARFAPVLFGLIRSCIMSFVISGAASFRTVRLAEGVTRIWVAAWLPSWIAACPVVTFVAPFTRRVVARLTRAPG